MSTSKIEWTEQVWNPLVGCTVHSPGCTHCYAMRDAWRKQFNPNTRIAAKYAGTVEKTRAGQPLWTGRINLSDDALLAPLRRRKPTRWFVNSMSDLFHENVPDAWIDRVFAVMALCPQHTFQVLTKRSRRMREYMTGLDRAARIVPGAITSIPQVGPDLMVASATWPLPNVWLGVSVEDQARADERIPDLLATPATLRWVSAEPLLGPVDLTMIQFTNERGGMEWWDALDLHSIEGEPMPEGNCEAVLDWIVAGGESGPNARPMHPDWARGLRDQCQAAGVPFFFKQWGEYLPIDSFAERDRSVEYHHDSDLKQGWHRVGKKAAGRTLDGRQHSEFPG